jgi:hypothetical protein
MKSKLFRYGYASDKGERSYGSYSLLTPALDGKWSSSRSGSALPPETGPVPIG